MVSFNLLTSLAALAASSLVSATPLDTRQSISAPFFLQTKVLEGDATKDGLFAVAYHSYAGGNDVALLPNTTDTPSSPAILNGTFVIFQLGQSVGPWGLELQNLDGGDYWDNWNTAGINLGSGDEANDGVNNGFFFNGTSLTANIYDFGGWLACDWARQVPQLFWFTTFTASELAPGNFPSSCAIVDLVKVPA